MKKWTSIILIAVFILSGSSLNFPGSLVYAEEKEEIEEKMETEAADFEENSILEVNSDEASPIETIVPIYNYEIDNVVVPTKYAMSLNPYGMPIVIKNDNVSTEQVISREYGIINKSSTDKIVTVIFIVEDLNKDKITFVNSEEAARNADEDTYAVYLTVIPADESSIRIGDGEVNMDTCSSALSDVDMTGTKEHAIALHAGENRITFKLAKAVYNFGDKAFVSGEKPEGNPEEVLNLIGLNPEGKSATAFTFGGAMNIKADWEKLLKGIKVTAVYEYRTADGSEKIVNGTGAMLASD